MSLHTEFFRVPHHTAHTTPHTETETEKEDRERRQRKKKEKIRQNKIR